MTIQVIEYENTTGEAMILLLDEENNKAESMTAETYTARLEAAKEASGTL